MTNLFSFDYELETLNNRDGSPSNYQVVFGDKGKIIHTKMDSYEVVTTQDLSAVGHAFIDSGLNTRAYSHRFGKVIGLNIEIGKRGTVVGDKSYSAYINVPNNGTGMGTLALNEKRLICSNGMTRTRLMHKDINLKIPHTLDYPRVLELVKRSTLSFIELIKAGEEQDKAFNDVKLGREDIMFHLNKWFHGYELPEPVRKTLPFDEFRRLLAVSPEKVPFIERYKDLKGSLTKELEYNSMLGLDQTLYTVFASVTNYLSRRREVSQSKAPEEVQNLRSVAKTAYFETVKVHYLS